MPAPREVCDGSGGPGGRAHQAPRAGARAAARHGFCFLGVGRPGLVCRLARSYGFLALPFDHSSDVIAHARALTPQGSKSREVREAPTFLPPLPQLKEVDTLLDNVRGDLVKALTLYKRLLPQGVCFV